HETAAAAAADGVESSSSSSSIGGFETLYEVVPWPMLSYDIGIDPNVHGSELTPRVFKSHLRMASIYPGCKYVVTIRDPARTAISFYNFFIAKRVPFLVEEENALGDDGKDDIRLLMDVSTFLVETPFVRGSDHRASIWEYYAEYHALLDCPNVLMLVYEDFISNDETRRMDNIRLLGKFMGVVSDDDSNNDNNNHEAADDQYYGLIARTASMSTKSYMARHM
ncbi:hypothetical protein ACHAXR_000283, partial [Thalassiosira sp. AJA248-18]